MTDIEQHDSVEVFVGVDVGKALIMRLHWIARKASFG